MITELDYRPSFYNLLNIMSRHREGYHIQIQEAAQTNMLMTPDDDPSQFEGEPVRAKEKGLENHIYVDWHRHGLFLDHFLGDQTTLHGFEAAQYPEQGDFVNQQYTSSVQQNDEMAEVTLIRNGNVWVGDLHVPVQIEKTMRLEKGKSNIRIRYRLINRGEVFLTGRFGVETAMGFDGGDSEQCYIEQNGTRRGLNESSEYYNVEKYTVASKLQQLALQFSLSQSAALWQFPLAPITLSEGGFERVHQGMVLLQWWPVNLAPSETWEFELQLDIKPLEQNEKGT
jgi:alpha-amylase